MCAPIRLPRGFGLFFVLALALSFFDDMFMAALLVDPAFQKNHAS